LSETVEKEGGQGSGGGAGTECPGEIFEQAEVRANDDLATGAVEAKCDPELAAAAMDVRERRRLT
jgi:hypothetical protein